MLAVALGCFVAGSIFGLLSAALLRAARVGDEGLRRALGPEATSPR